MGFGGRKQSDITMRLRHDIAEWREGLSSMQSLRWSDNATPQTIGFMCVRKSAEWQCQRCGKDYSEKHQGLQCSHFISRMVTGGRGTTHGSWRSVPICHNYVEGHPVEHINLWKASTRR